MKIANNLTGKGKEIFASSIGLMVVSKMRIKPISNQTLSDLKSFAFATPERKKVYQDMAGDNENDQLLKCTKCMFSSLDGQPDIDENGNITPEVVDCGKRGSCKWEGIGCLPIPESPLDKLTDGQKRVVSLLPMQTKQIASKLFISTRTAVNHIQAAKKILGAANVGELIELTKIIN